MLGNKSQREKLAVVPPVDILGRVISSTDKAHNLGVIFYSDFFCSNHQKSQARHSRINRKVCPQLWLRFGCCKKGWKRSSLVSNNLKNQFWINVSN